MTNKNKMRIIQRQTTSTRRFIIIMLFYRRNGVIVTWHLTFHMYVSSTKEKKEKKNESILV